MNWFKHKTDEHNNIVVSEACGLFGHSGYKFYFILHELYGKYYNERNENDCIEISMKNLSKINNINETKTKKILDYYKEKGKIYFTIHNGIIFFKINGFKMLHNKWQDRREEKLSTNVKKTPVEERKEETRKKEADEENNKKDTNKKMERVYEKLASQILETLNRATGRDYSDTRYIIPLLRKGKKFEDFILIIFNKCNDEFFIKNPKLMTPKTLFKEEMFDIYANENKEKKEVNYNE